MSVANVAWFSTSFFGFHELMIELQIYEKFVLDIAVGAVHMADL